MNEKGADDEDTVFVPKVPVDCLNLFNHTIDEANTKFIKLFIGISGTIGSLVIDRNNRTNTDGLPIGYVVA